MQLPPALRASTLRDPTRTPFLQVIKTTIAIAASWLAGLALFPQQPPVFAAIAALLCVQPSVNQSVGKAIQRSVGVVIGVIVAHFATLAFGRATWLVIAAIVVSMLLAWALRLTAGSGNQIAISAMLVIALGAANPQYATERIIETVLGAVIGVLVNVLIVAPVLSGPAHAAVSDLTRQTASALDRLAAALKQRQNTEWLETMLNDARQLRAARADASEALDKADESLALNPRSARHRRRLAADADALDRLSPIITQVLGMTRTVHDNYDDALPEEPTIRSIAVELGRAAHDLRLLAPDHVPRLTSDAQPKTSELPALTTPLSITRPSDEHWVLTGALMEDLRRVREEILAAGERGREPMRPVS